MDFFIIGAIVLFVAMFVARFIQITAYQNLGKTDQKKLVGIFKKQQNQQLMLAAIVVVGFIAVVYFKLLPLKTGLTALAVVVTGLLSYNYFNGFNTLIQSNISKHYIRAFKHSSLIRGVGMVVFMVALIVSG